MVAAAFMDLLDGTIMQVALPSIERGMHVSDAGLQWAAASYPLVFALLLITAARLADILGRKRVFLAGLAAFVIASALVALSPGAGLLIGFRALQGAAAALMVASRPAGRCGDSAAASAGSCASTTRWRTP
jgi:MFS family permease